MVFGPMGLSFPVGITYSLFDPSLIHLRRWRTNHVLRTGHWAIRRWAFCSLEASTLSEFSTYFSQDGSADLPKDNILLILCHQGLASVGQDFILALFPRPTGKALQHLPSPPGMQPEGSSWSLFLPGSTGRPHLRVLPECLVAEDPP